MYKIADSTKDNTTIIPVTENFEPVEIVNNSDDVIFVPEEIEAEGTDIAVNNTYNDTLEAKFFGSSDFAKNGTVTVSGKNLFDLHGNINQKYISGIMGGSNVINADGTITVNSNTVQVAGVGYKIDNVAGKTFTFSFDVISTGTGKSMYASVCTPNKINYALKTGIKSAERGVLSVSFDNDVSESIFTLIVQDGTGGVVKNVQIERGSSATKYELYRGCISATLPPLYRLEQLDSATEYDYIDESGKKWISDCVEKKRIFENGDFVDKVCKTQKCVIETVTDDEQKSTQTLYKLAEPIVTDITDTAEGQAILQLKTIPYCTRLYSDYYMKAKLRIWGDSDVVGLQVDYAAGCFKRLAGAANKTAGSDFDRYKMYGGRKRCNVSDDGTITAYYGDDDYAEDGSMGQVMVYQPAFYYKVEPLRIDKNTTGIGYHMRIANYYVSTKPKTGFKLHPAFYDANGNPVDYILLSAYEGSMYDVSAEEFVNDETNTDITIGTGDILCSVAGVKPISGLKKNLTKANLELMAQNRNTGWHLETIKATSANQLLMIIELGTMNTQTGIGQGVTAIPDSSAYNCSSLTGSTSALGNATGQAASTVNEIGGVETTYNTAGKVSVAYRGVENFWGNIWKHIQGVNIWGDGTMCGGQPYVASNFIFNESKHSDNYEGVGFTLPNADGYIKAMGYGKEEFDWLFMPSEIGGTSALPVGDYFYRATNLNGYRIAQFGGHWYSGSNAGGFFWYCNNGVGGHARNIGGRLLYIPKGGDEE